MMKKGTQMQSRDGTSIDDMVHHGKLQSNSNSCELPFDSSYKGHYVYVPVLHYKNSDVHTNFG